MSNSWLGWSRSKLPCFLGEAAGGLIGELGCTDHGSRCLPLHPTSDKGNALGGFGLPTDWEAVGRDEVRGCHALPRQPWLTL